MFVEENHFYFMKDSYFRDFPEAGLMPNKIIVNNAVHDRPAYFALRDSTDPEILWFIPISSKISKYNRIAEEKKRKFGRCDTIVFGDILGHECAFLIQNMCPITSRYIENEYMDHNHYPVRIPYRLEKTLSKKVRRILLLEGQGKRITFSNVMKIKHDMLERAKTSKAPSA